MSGLADWVRKAAHRRDGMAWGEGAQMKEGTKRMASCRCLLGRRLTVVHLIAVFLGWLDGDVFSLKLDLKNIYVCILLYCRADVM